jgi:hypothetical protein
MRNLVLSSLLLLTLIASARAAENAPRPGDAIKPFVDEQTFAVIALDLTAIDADAINAWTADVIKALKLEDADAKQALAGVKMGTDQLRVWTDTLRKAGARRMFAIINLGELPAVPIVVPVEGGADEKAIAAALAGIFKGFDLFFEIQVQTVGKAVVAAPAATIDRLRELKPIDRADLVAALLAGGDAPACIALAPSRDQRRVIAELGPNLPKELGGGSTLPFAQGMTWAAAAIGLPHKVSLNVAIQCKDAAAAKELWDMLPPIKKAGAERRGLILNFEQLFDAFTPTQAGDRLTLSLDSTAINQRIVALIAQDVPNARQSAKKAQSLGQVHQFYNACMMYRADHKNQWPDDLQSLTRYLKDPSIFVSPLNPEKKIGYVYIKPSEKLNPADVMFYEAFDAWPQRGIGVCYGDGSARWVESEQQFKAQLKATQDRRQ